MYYTFANEVLIFFRQTSDPRSGFATVEKDLPGGLTPMLGDKKVSLTLFLHGYAGKYYF